MKGPRTQVQRRLKGKIFRPEAAVLGLKAFVRRPLASKRVAPSGGYSPGEAGVGRRGG